MFARKLVEAFGDRVFDVIDSQPGRLRDVDGIGAGRAAQIVEAWSGQKVIRDIMVFLYGHGVGTSRAVRIYKTRSAASARIHVTRRSRRSGSAASVSRAR